MPGIEVEVVLQQVGSAMSGAHREMREAAQGVSEAAQEVSDRAQDLTRQAVDRSFQELTRFGRMILRLWNFGERAASPPWTLKKVLGWACLALAIALVTVTAYQLEYGILTLPIIAQAGSDFVAALAALGPAGLFVFTAIGTLFFMIIPTEPFFFIVLAGAGSPGAAIVAAALGSTVGSCANYVLGNRVRVSAGKKTGEERKLGKWGMRAHSKGGAVLLFLSASLPLPEIIGFAYGLADYPFKKFVVITAAARAVKWTWIAGAFLYLSVTF